MWRLTSRFLVGMFAATMLTNAAAVYLLHDVDADRLGKLNLAYWDLTLEFLTFGLVAAAAFFLLAWIGTLVFGLRDIPANLKLGLVLGIAVILIQYPAEFTVRKLSPDSADAFLLGYLLLSPIACSAIILLDSHKRRRTNLARDKVQTGEIATP